MKRSASTTLFAIMACATGLAQQTSSGVANVGDNTGSNSGQYVSMTQMSTQAASYRASATALRMQAARQTGAAQACTLAQAGYLDCESNALGGLGGYTTPAMESAYLAACRKPVCSGGGGAVGIPGIIPSAGSSTLMNTINNGVAMYQLGKAFGLWGNNNSQPAAPADTGPTPEQIAEQEQAEEAARQRQINADATNILNEANSLVASNNPPASPVPPATDSTSEVSSLLGGDTPAPDSTTAVTNLLGDTPDPSTSTTDAVTNLLGGNTVDDSASAFPTSPALSAVTPTNPAIQAADSDSQDMPVPTSDIATVRSETDVPNPSPSIVDNLKDGLRNIISDVQGRVQATLGSLANSPIGQIYSAVNGYRNGDAPDILATDTPDQAADKVFAQSIVGIKKLDNEKPWEAFYDYNSAMIEKNSQMIDRGMSELGLASGVQ